ncbi:hypothetical protein N184_27315 [Sinorhizobium sp. GL28]|nr:hypothetical protein N184_27315 [Sinorhizobium sp. GL28]
MTGFSQNDLQDDILAAFQRAFCQGRLDVAEHLLRALETACDTHYADDSALDDAYRAMAGLRTRS